MSAILTRWVPLILLSTSIMLPQRLIASERCVEITVFGIKLYIRQSLIAFVHDGGSNQSDTIVALSIPASLLNVQLSPAAANKPRHSIAASLQLESNDRVRLAELKAATRNFHYSKDDGLSSGSLPSGSVLMIPDQPDRPPYIVCQAKLGGILAGTPQFCDVDQDAGQGFAKLNLGIKSLTIKYGFLYDDMKNISLISRNVTRLVNGFTEGCII